MVGAWPGGPRPDVYGAFGVQAVHGGLHDVQFVLDAGSKLSKTKTEIKYAKKRRRRPEVDEVGVKEDVVGGAQRVVGAEEHGCRLKLS